MEKRFEFKCWKCEKTYTLFREITDQQELFVPCPYCNAEAVVKLAPYRTKNTTLFRKVDLTSALFGDDLVLPAVLPTQKPD